MASTKFKFAINNAKFPFLYSQATRSVLLPGADIAPRTSEAFTGNRSSFDYNTVQMVFCENILPTATGLMSCGVREYGAPIAPAVTDFDQILTLRDSQEANYLFVPARGKNYIFDDVTGEWTSYSAFSWASDKKLVSTAYVLGRTLVCYERDRIVEFDPSTPALDTVSLTYPAGYSISDIRGICGSSNYLIAHTATELLWSSLLDVTNLADTAGGAGRQTPIDLRGPITGLVPIAGGFLIFTTRNVVAAFSTNNAATPFAFREVAGSAGVASTEQVTKDANQTELFSYSTSGFQALNLQQAQIVFADCTDFLANRTYDQWDATIGGVVEYSQSDELHVKLQLLGNRFLFISYVRIGNEYQFALVYDLGLQRWGKIRQPHVDVGLAPNPGGAVYDLLYNDLQELYDTYNVVYEDLRTAYADYLPARTGFLFLRENGQLNMLVTDPASGNEAGVALFGRVQLARSKTVTFVSATFDGLYSTPTPTLRLAGSLPGNGLDRNSIVTIAASTVTPRMLQYAGRHTFENFDLAVEGKFFLSAGILEVMNHGSR